MPCHPKTHHADSRVKRRLKQTYAHEHASAWLYKNADVHVYTHEHEQNMAFIMSCSSTTACNPRALPHPQEEMRTPSRTCTSTQSPITIVICMPSSRHASPELHHPHRTNALRATSCRDEVCSEVYGQEEKDEQPKRLPLDANLLAGSVLSSMPLLPLSRDPQSLATPPPSFTSRLHHGRHTRAAASV